MIILEGPDGGGKTRLSLRLQEELRVPIEPRAVTFDMEATVPLDEWVVQQMSSWPRCVIYDRFAMISEFIYGPLFRGGIRFGENLPRLRHLHKMFRASDPAIIFCLPPIEEVQAWIASDPANAEAAPMIEGVYWSYHNLVAQYDGAFVWDFTKPETYDPLISRVKDKLWKDHRLEY